MLHRHFNSDKGLTSSNKNLNRKSLQPMCVTKPMNDFRKKGSKKKLLRTLPHIERVWKEKCQMTNDA